jgi:hypothetical protein
MIELHVERELHVECEFHVGGDDCSRIIDSTAIGTASGPMGAERPKLFHQFMAWWQRWEQRDHHRNQADHHTRDDTVKRQLGWGDDG